ncbi:hypothetical protein CAEBREN_14811 [Caenorhabditis brenneri]|uniref:Ion transport domain-containing protein n=1 Tax=Caenorhabditis brenneri TaxID=135651 RepID=G0M8Z7_CAEBE|nr:hypothetical protein CAEBREN_14811 [Caenorhabditis brenneri]
MILAAFFGRNRALVVSKERENRVTLDPSKHEKFDFLVDCRLPLHTVIVMCYAAHYMRNLFIKEGSGLETEQEKYENLKNNFQDVACRIVNHLYLHPRKGPEQARAVLQADYNPEKTLKKDKQNLSTYRDYLDRKFNQNKEIMAIAYKAEAMKFLSQKPCMYLMKIRYKCRDRKQRICEGAYGVRKIHQCIFWCPSMKFKLWFHAIFRIIYILMFAYMLCRVPVYDDHHSVSKRGWDEEISVHYVLAVLYTQLFMTLWKVSNRYTFSPKSSDTFPKWLYKYYRSNRLAMWRIFLISFIFVFEAIRLLIGAFGSMNTDETNYYSVLVFIPLILELVYCLLFIISAIATLRFFYSIKSLGFFTHLITKMLKTVRMFVFIFCAFWFVLAVTHVSISRTFTAVNSTTNNTFIHTIASHGKFEIFGEIEDNDKEGSLAGCDDYNRTIHHLFSMDYKEASCLFRSSVLPFLMFLYIFMAGVLLVNLLTAQLTKEYEKEAEKSCYYNGYLQYEQLCKIESKIYLPPPLSIIYLILVLLLAPFCCYAPCFRFLCENTIKRIDGDPYQAVKKYVDKFGAEIEVKKFLREKQNNTWGKMKDLIAKYEQDESNYESLVTVQMQLNRLLKEEKDRVKTREIIQSRRGTYSRMEDIDYDDPAVEACLP